MLPLLRCWPAFAHVQVMGALVIVVAVEVVMDNKVMNVTVAATVVEDVVIVGPIQTH